MLLEFACSNHMSIKDKVVFSLIADADATFGEYLKDFGKYKVLPSAVIYGANGSGKTSFLNALAFARGLVANSINNQPEQKISQDRHKLSSADSPSEYTMQFVHDEIRYAYGFTIAQNKIKTEYLYYFPEGRQVKIFERADLEIDAGDGYEASFELSKTILKDNRLFLSCAANYSNVKEVEEAFSFFAKDMVVYNSSSSYSWIRHSISMMQENDAIKDRFVSILQSLGTGIKDVKAKLEEVKLSDFLQDPIPMNSIDDDDYISKTDAKVIYENFEVDLMTEESGGIRKLFEIICPIIDILEKGKVLIFDEIEFGLHEIIALQIIRFFQRHNKKDTFAQLVFSTHNTSLLDSGLFRRDQIWFTQLKEDRSTDLYSLLEIKDVRKSENIAKGYIEGRYGAIPMLNENFSLRYES